MAAGRRRQGKPAAAFDNATMSIRLACLFLCTALPLASAIAATLTVGPGGDAARFSDAARLAGDGDTIQVLPGDYVGDVAVLTQRSLHIRGVGARPVFHAGGAHAEGKAIWVVRNGNVTIENIEFRGARVPDQNGAGIRFEKGRLQVVDCSFVDNEMGILTSNDGDAELVVRNSSFAMAPHRPGDGLTHLLYVGRIRRLEITGSRFAQGHRGHLIKSRAMESRIVGNDIVDGPLGEASYEIDLPNGGVALVADNRIGQAAGTNNLTMLSFGAEGHAWPRSSLELRDNVFRNDAPAAQALVHIWWSRLPLSAQVHGQGNRLIGPGRLPAALTR
jgi:hypothetical protein